MGFSSSEQDLESVAAGLIEAASPVALAWRRLDGTLDDYDCDVHSRDFFLLAPKPNKPTR